MPIFMYDKNGDYIVKSLGEVSDTPSFAFSNIDGSTVCTESKYVLTFFHVQLLPMSFGPEHLRSGG